VMAADDPINDEPGANQGSDHPRRPSAAGSLPSATLGGDGYTADFRGSAGGISIP
jgi:hypothetical protein